MLSYQAFIQSTSSDIHMEGGPGGPLNRPPPPLAHTGPHQLFPHAPPPVPPPPPSGPGQHTPTSRAGQEGGAGGGGGNMGHMGPQGPGGMGGGPPNTLSAAVTSTSPLVVPTPKMARPIKTYHCRMCDQEFENKSDMQHHSKDVHRMQEKSHKCTKCLKSFPTSQQLVQHSLVHTNIRKFHCQYCEKSFKQLSHVQQHQRIHTGERPYKCTVETCSKAFAQLSNLQQHLKNHDAHMAQSDKKPHCCHICDRRFATEASLNHHMNKLHTSLARPHDLTCQVCEKQCHDEERFFKHIHKHHPDYWRVFAGGRPLSDFIGPREVKRRDKPYQCQICHKRYSHETGYVKHLAMHPESDPSLKTQLWTCTVCQKLFTKESYLLRHMEMKLDERHNADLVVLKKKLKIGTEKPLSLHGGPVDSVSSTAAAVASAVVAATMGTAPPVDDEMEGRPVRGADSTVHNLPEDYSQPAVRPGPHHHHQHHPQQQQQQQQHYDRTMDGPGHEQQQRYERPNTVMEPGHDQQQQHYDKRSQTPLTSMAPQQPHKSYDKHGAAEREKGGENHAGECSSSDSSMHSSVQRVNASAAVASSSSSSSAGSTSAAPKAQESLKFSPLHQSSQVMCGSVGVAGLYAAAHHKDPHSSQRDSLSPHTSLSSSPGTPHSSISRSSEVHIPRPLGGENQQSAMPRPEDHFSTPATSDDGKNEYQRPGGRTTHASPAIGSPVDNLNNPFSLRRSHSESSFPPTKDHHFSPVAAGVAETMDYSRPGPGHGQSYVRTAETMNHFGAGAGFLHHGEREGDVGHPGGFRHSALHGVLPPSYLHPPLSAPPYTTSAGGLHNPYLPPRPELAEHEVASALQHLARSAANYR